MPRTSRLSLGADLLGRLLLGLALAGLIFAPAPIAAQDTDPAESEEAASDDEAVAEDDRPTVGDVITVTARKREESLQEVPVAVTVVTADALEEEAVQDLGEIQERVPNLSIYPGRNQSTTLTAFMRGIGQADPLWGVDPGVGLYLDDVYIARPQGALLDVFDVQRIEVLRGPQGTLYGKNTIGGAIRYISSEPSDTPEGSISISGGSYSAQNLKFRIGGPLIEGKLRGKLAVASLQHDGYGRNRFQDREVSNKDTFAYRVALDWLASEGVRVSFSADGTRDDAEPKGLTRLETNPLCPFFPPFTACPPLGRPFDTQSGIVPANGTDSEGYSLTVFWDVNDNWDFKSITAYRESDSENNIDFDTFSSQITDVFATYFDDQTSQEFQFLYDGGGALTGVFGLYYFDGFAGGLVRNIFLGGSPFINPLYGTTDGDTQTEQFAIFGDGSYAINDRATFNFGLRVTEEEKTGRAFNAGYTDETFSVVSIVTADYNQSETFTSVAPRLGIDYQFNPDVMGYVSLSRGFKSGGFNVRAQSTFFPDSAQPFDDEVLDVAEVGIKSQLADRRLLLNAALFYGDYKDVQVSTFTSFDSDGDGTDDAFFGNFLNAGDATLTGAELEWDYALASLDWLRISGNLSYLDTSTGFLDQNSDGFVDTQVITNAPELTGALFLNTNFSAFGGLITGRVGYAYRDDSTLTNEGGPDPRDPTGQTPLTPIVQPSYDLITASVSWLSGDGKWRFSVNGKNLGDELYLTNGYNIPVLGILQGSFGAPRTVLATIEYNFF